MAFPSFSVDNAVPDANMAVGDTQIVQWVDFSYVVCSKIAPFACGPSSRVMRCGAAWQPGTRAQPTMTASRSCSGMCKLIAGFCPKTCWLLPTQSVSLFPPATTQPAAISFTNFRFSVMVYPTTKNGVSGRPVIFKPGTTLVPVATILLDRYFVLITEPNCLAGDPTAEQICHQYSSNDDSLLPADIDSPTVPPTGQDEFAIGSLGHVDNSHLSAYSAHINNQNDWTQGATFTGDNNSQLIAITPFTSSCDGRRGGDCVPQKGTTTKLTFIRRSPDVSVCVLQRFSGRPGRNPSHPPHLSPGWHVRS